MNESNVVTIDMKRLVTSLVAIYAPKELPYVDSLLDSTNADYRTPAYAVGAGEPEILTAVLIGAIGGATGTLTSDAIKALAKRIWQAIQEWRKRNQSAATAAPTALNGVEEVEMHIMKHHT